MSSRARSGSSSSPRGTGTSKSNGGGGGADYRKRAAAAARGAGRALGWGAAALRGCYAQLSPERREALASAALLGAASYGVYLGLARARRECRAECALCADQRRRDYLVEMQFLKCDDYCLDPRGPDFLFHLERVRVLFARYCRDQEAAVLARPCECRHCEQCGF